MRKTSKMDRNPSPDMLQRPIRKGRPNLRLHGQLAKHYAMQILSGELAEGYSFPGEIDLSERLGVSRTALREAFRILSAKGLLESRPKFGTRVAPRSHWSVLDPELLGWQFQAEPSLGFIRDLFELRAVVEPAAAALAAGRWQDGQIAEMEAALGRMEQFGLATDSGREADQLFHMVILEAAGNALLAGLASSVTAAISWTTLLKARRSVDPRDPIEEHRQLLHAIRARDADGSRRAMLRLIELALADTEQVLIAEPAG